MSAGRTKSTPVSHQRRILHPSREALFGGIGCVMMGPAFVVFLLNEFPKLNPAEEIRRILFVGLVIFFIFISAGAVYMIMAWNLECMVINASGFIWHELFRHREVKWVAIRKAVWREYGRNTHVRLKREPNKDVVVFFSQFRRNERRWLMDVIHEAISADCQEGWDQIEKARMRSEQASEPFNNGDRWLFVAAVAGFAMALIFWLKSHVYIPKTLFTLCGTFGVLTCPIVLLMSAWDLIRREPTHWLATAFTLSVVNCLLIVMGFLILVGRI